MDRADRVLQEIEDYSKKRGLPIVGSRKGEVISDIVKKYSPKRGLEVGTLYGYSAILIGKHLPDGGSLLTLEIDPEAAEIARENIDRAGLTGTIQVRVGDALRLIPELDGNFDFLFLDADKEQYLDYLFAVEEKLADSAVVVADNVGMFSHQLNNYLKYVREEGNYESHIFDLGFDALEVSVYSN